MKKFFLVMTGLFFVVLANAQTRRQNINTATTTTTANLSKDVERMKKPNGDVLIRTEIRRFKLYAVFANSKVSDYYAIDESGRRLKASYSAAGPTSLYCQVCINSGGTNQTCYEVDCSKIPPPKQATTNTRQ